MPSCDTTHRTMVPVDLAELAISARRAATWASRNARSRASSGGDHQKRRSRSAGPGTEPHVLHTGFRPACSINVYWEKEWLRGFESATRSRNSPRAHRRQLRPHVYEDAHRVSHSCLTAADRPPEVLGVL